MWVAVMMRHPELAIEARYRDYLIRRLIHSLARAERARTSRERAVHLRACRIYCDLLNAA